MRIRVKKDAFLKQKLKNSSELADSEKTLVQAGTELDIQYYRDVGVHHWQVQLLEPTLGDKASLIWYVYEPDIELKSSIKLKLKTDTFFKVEPHPSSELNETQKIFFKRGTEFEVASYLPALGNHLNVVLASANFGPEKRNNWYVYRPDAEIKGQRQELKVISDSLFKAEPKMASQLNSDQKILIKSGVVFELSAYSAPTGNHLKVSLEGAFLGPKNLTDWYAYVPDIEIIGSSPDNAPNDTNPGKQPANPKDLGKAMRFPDLDGIYYAHNPILWKTAYGELGNFTWGEATHGGTRIPESQDVVYGIVRVAKALEDIRHLYEGRAMTINSWYRPPAVNRAVGGVRHSRHLSGDAVDFNVDGVHPYDVYAQLDDWWGSKGGLASSSVFTHIDTRGYRARWAYHC